MRLKAKKSDRIFITSTGKLGEQYLTEGKVYVPYYSIGPEGKQCICINDDEGTMHIIAQCRDEVIEQSDYFEDTFDIMI